MTSRFFLIISMMLMFLTGCATVVTKTKANVQISSDPSDSKFIVEDQFGKVVYNGKTPATVLLDKGQGLFIGSDYTVTVSREGYEPKKLQIQRGFSGFYLLGNMPLLPILPVGLAAYLIVDPASGAMWKLDETPPVIRLRPAVIAQQ
jgi:uncharacterized protein YceK